MSDFGEQTQGRTTPYTQESSGAQTNNQRNAIPRIESCPRLPARPDSTVATIDSDVTLRHGVGLLHASTDRQPDGCPAIGHTPVVSNAHDPCPADVDEDQNQKWQENDGYNDAVNGSTPAQSFPAGAVAPKGARSTNLRYSVVGGKQLDHHTLYCCQGKRDIWRPSTWGIGWVRSCVTDRRLWICTRKSDV